MSKTSASLSCLSFLSCRHLNPCAVRNIGKTTAYGDCLVLSGPSRQARQSKTRDCLADIAYRIRTYGKQDKQDKKRFVLLRGS